MLSDVRYALDQLRALLASLRPSSTARDRVRRAMDALKRVEPQLVEHHGSCEFCPFNGGGCIVCR